jgi:hypothetical protein
LAEIDSRISGLIDEASMKKQWIAINLLLLFLTGLLAWQLNHSIQKFQQSHRLSQIRPAKNLKQKAAQDKVLPESTDARILNAAEFSVIPEKNIFSESRSRDDKTEVSVIAEAPPLTQKPILVGIAISENQKLASIIDPTSPPQNQRSRAQTKRIGDVYQGYTITNITSDSIVLESGTKREIIPLHEGVKRPQGGKTPILSIQVVSFGSGAGIAKGAGAPIVISGSPATGARGQAPQGAPVAIPAPYNVTQPSGSRGTTAGRGTTAPTRPNSPVAPTTSPQAQPAPNTGNAPIRTPFGDMSRPNP